MQKLIEIVTEIYQEKKEIKTTALEATLLPNKSNKLLITGDVMTYPKNEQIQEF